MTKLTNNEKPGVIQIEKIKRRLRVGDPDFKPPDGGWGWLIVFACGFSNLSTFPMFQQFGLVFRTKFEELQISSAQTTTVINMNSAFNSCMGLLNGPLFRRFTYRQVALCGSFLVASSLFLCQFCNSFWGYMILYSALYGSGIGITQSSNALALNTYFKEKRRLATGFSWSTTALGPIMWPYIIVALNSLYGVEGTVLIFSGFALHSFVCSLLLQPVEWHTKVRICAAAAVLENGQTENEAKREWTKLRKNSFLSGQYLHNEDDSIHTGFEITAPGTPMMVKYNDGWYLRPQMGSRLSLSSNKSMKSDQGSKPTSNSNLPDYGKYWSGSQIKRKLSEINILTITEKLEHDVKYEKSAFNGALGSPKKHEILKKAVKMLTGYKDHNQHMKYDDIEKEKELEKHKPRKMSIWQKIAIFFGFELFKDPVYVNLMLGITIANFAELNFSILTPMVLKEFNFEQYETASFMSLLGATDILVRFFIPFIADKIGWENKTFFLGGGTRDGVWKNKLD